MKSRAQRIAGFAQSEIRAMTREAEARGAINLGQGLCDLPTHPEVEAGAIEAIKRQQNTYSYAEGTVALREAIAEKVERDNGIATDPARNIVISIGATGAYTATVNSLLDPGDGILLFEPYYGYHLGAALVAGLDVQFAPLAPPEFTLTEDLLRQHLKPNTKAVVLCTPANPSGKMFSRQELEILAKVASERDLLVITDEIYEYIRFDNREHISPASLPQLRDRTVSVMGVSKTFSITGWRIGYTVAPEELTRSISLVNDIYYVCAPTPLQLGVAKGMRAPKSYFDGIGAMYQKKRDVLCDALRQAGLPPLVPQGAYYVLADVSSLGFATAKEASMALVEEAGVAAVSGRAFFRSEVGEKYLRFCFAKDDDEIEQAAQRLVRFRK